MCGISGYISNGKTKLNKTIIKTLGCWNDSRGGDSVGLFIDDKVEYGIDKTKLFSSFMMESELLKNTKIGKYVFTHCRKRSVGDITVETAQPVVIYNDNNDVDYVLMHNGTIFNADDLWKSHNPEFDLLGSWTDSQKMARLFYHYGYDDLTKYNGAAAFAILDYREDRNNPRVFFFKGASKDTKYSPVVIEERPLFLAYEKDKFIFSSIRASIVCVTEKEVLTLNPNKLCELTDDGLIVIEEYDRSNCCQQKEYVYDAKKNHQTQSKAYSRAYDDYGGYDNYSDCECDDYAFYGKKQKGAKNNHNDESSSWNRKVGYDRLEGKFFIGAKNIAHGGIHCSSFGYNTTEFNSKKLYFFGGHMLKGGEKTFNFITKQYQKQLNDKFITDMDEFIDYFMPIIRRYSLFPFLNPKSRIYEIEDEYNNIVKVTGLYIIPFDSYYKALNIANGEVVDSQTTTYLAFVKDYDRYSKLATDDSVFNWDEEEELYKQHFEIV